MRILITAGFLGHFGETDGVATTYRHLLPFYERTGWEVDVLAYGPQDGVERRGNIQLYVHRPRVPLRVDPQRWIDLAFAASPLARTLGRVPYALVQSSTPDPMGTWAGGLACRRRVPMVALYHTALADYAAIRGRRLAGPVAGRLMGRYMDARLRRYFDGADLVLAPSEAVRAELATQLRPPVAVIGRGVDADAFHPGRRRRGSGRVRALYVGRLAPEKNLDLLARLFASPSELDLMIVGDGPAGPELRARLPHATFTGKLIGDALARAYADADFFVFPSRTDTLGNVVLEAMASGLPVVVTDAMGPKELVRQGATGFVATSDGEFAAAVQALAARPDLRQSMGAAGRRFAETRSWASIFEELVGHYRRLQPELDRPPMPAMPLAPGRRPTAPVRPLRVLDITEYFGETSGGVKTYLTHKAEYVAGRPDLQQVVVVPGADDGCQIGPNVRWYRVRGPRIPGLAPYRLMLSPRRIREIVARERPDIVEVGSPFLAPWLVAEVAEAVQAPLLWFCHSNLPCILAPYSTSAWARKQAAGVSRTYVKALGRRCAATLAPSHAMADELAALDVPNVHRVTLGVDTSCFHPRRRAHQAEVRRRLDLPAGPLVLYAGRITTEKTVDLLLAAWPRLERETEAHLILVGDGPDRRRLQARHCSARVHWRPYEAERDRLADLMAAADLYVAPSVVETFGLAALEAMACGTPVLSAARGAVAEHVRRSGAGAVFASGSAASLAEQAAVLLAHATAPAFPRGSDYVARHLSWGAALDRIFAVYEQILESGAVRLTA